MRRVSIIILVLFALPDARKAQARSARADVLLRQGKQLLDAGNTAAACDAFDESHKLDPRVTTVLEQARCRETNGQLATALSLYRTAAAQGNAIARGHAERLKPRVSTLSIIGAREVEFEVRCGGELIRGRSARRTPSTVVRASSPRARAMAVTGR